MLLLPRLRLALARRPWMYWLFVGCCAAIVWSTLSSAQSRLGREREQWGETRRVWVAPADIAAGEVVHSVAHDYPIAMLPPSAIDAQPVDAIAATAIAEGEVLVASDLAAADRSVPADWVVFALANDKAPTLQQGDRVALFGSGQRLCDGAVVTVGDDAIEVGVSPQCADAISAQVAIDSVVLAALA